MKHAVLQNWHTPSSRPFEQLMLSSQNVDVVYVKTRTTTVVVVCLVSPEPGSVFLTSVGNNPLNPFTCPHSSSYKCYQHVLTKIFIGSGSDKDCFVKLKHCEISQLRHCVTGSSCFQGAPRGGSLRGPPGWCNGALSGGFGRGLPPH